MSESYTYGGIRATYAQGRVEELLENDDAEP
jgi:hypothetical protein